MAAPAKAGAILYAKNLQRLSDFYQDLLDAQLLYIDAIHAVLQAIDVQLVIHAIPEAIAASIELQQPAVARTETAIKLFVSVPSLQQAAELAHRHQARLQTERWQGPGFVAANLIDPEGNVLQLRQFDAQSSSL